jgi:uncharacterized membrane protein YedE/YeeE
MIESLFPNGISSYLWGGIILGVSVALMYLPTAYIPGASSVLTSFFSFFTKRIPAKFREYRFTHFFGVIIGAIIFTALFSAPFTTEVSLWRLLIGGFLVGLGATLARGCTSGHGICGLASLSKSSFAYVAIFMVVAIITALTVASLGVTP